MSSEHPARRLRAGAEILILARTDARQTHGLSKALWRVGEFARMGADIVFLEAPRSVDEMRASCEVTDCPKLANMLEDGKSPWLAPNQLEALGIKIVAYPLTLLNSASVSMQRALQALAHARRHEDQLGFAELRELLGFEGYEQVRRRYGEAQAITCQK